MKNIIFIIFTIIALWVPTSKADVVVPCLECTYEQAKTKALFEARERWTYESPRYLERFAVIDPVVDLVRTFNVSMLYEPELGRIVKESVQYTYNDIDIENAVSTYNLLIVEIYNHWGEIQSSDGTFKIYNSISTSSTSAPDIEVDRNGYLYKILRGQTLYNLPYPSYSWLASDKANEAEVNRRLISLMSLDSILSTLTLAARARLNDILLGLPLQYTVRFENGDTVAFAFNFFGTLMFKPLHETARDALGNSISTTNRTSGGGSLYGSGYTDFYSKIDTAGLFMKKVCTIAYTGTSGNMESEQVCWIVYL